MCNPQTVAASLPPESGRAGTHDSTAPAAERPVPRVTLPTGTVRDLTHVRGP
ncbi:hypothetical protein OG596_04285 [Streptomyces sp. NBC_01102]|uniref:hypothetical protein n=1 Tax=Streptomyces sp. NBC_01102 TaxID=2903749 RepID=UPI0038661A5A|nr:hypothetical protein OG596_04285 [Streptomyces sp. NBC_01102]